ncbi:MAG: hypothetical protein HKL80_08105 [Acidimicrobiales bacterium]|nr:hypothetical protein [Acidimicrobiales bacterium]
MPQLLAQSVIAVWINGLMTASNRETSEKLVEFISLREVHQPLNFQFQGKDRPQNRSRIQRVSRASKRREKAMEAISNCKAILEGARPSEPEPTYIGPSDISVIGKSKSYYVERGQIGDHLPAA